LNHTPKDLNHTPKDLNHTPKGPKAKKAKLSEMEMEPMDQLDPVIIIFYSSDEDIKYTCALNGSTIATKLQVVWISLQDKLRLSSRDGCPVLY